MRFYPSVSPPLHQSFSHEHQPEKWLMWNSQTCRSDLQLFPSVLIQSHLFTPASQKRSTTVRLLDAKCSCRTVQLSSLGSEVAPFCICKVMQLFQDLNWVKFNKIFFSSLQISIYNYLVISLLSEVDRDEFAFLLNKFVGQLLWLVYREPTAQTPIQFWQTEYCCMYVK